MTPTSFAGTVAPDLHGLDAEETVLQLERRLAESMRARDLRTRVDEDHCRASARAR